MVWNRLQPSDRMMGSRVFRIRPCQRCFFSRIFSQSHTRWVLYKNWPHCNCARAVRVFTASKFKSNSFTGRILTALICYLCMLTLCTYLQVPNTALTRAQASEDNGIVGIEVADKLARYRGDFHSDVHSWPEAFILHPRIIIHVLELCPVELKRGGRNKIISFKCIKDRGLIVFRGWSHTSPCFCTSSFRTSKCVASPSSYCSSKSSLSLRFFSRRFFWRSSSSAFTHSSVPSHSTFCPTQHVQDNSNSVFQRAKRSSQLPTLIIRSCFFFFPPMPSVLGHATEYFVLTFSIMLTIYSVSRSQSRWDWSEPTSAGCCSASPRWTSPVSRSSKSP